MKSCTTLYNTILYVHIILDIQHYIIIYYIYYIRYINTIYILYIILHYILYILQHTKVSKTEYITTHNKKDKFVLYISSLKSSTTLYSILLLYYILPYIAYYTNKT